MQIRLLRVVITLFTFSLAIDISKGLCFIHAQDMFYGRLTSATCFIDSRFSVKLADVGLHSIFDNLDVDKMSQEYKYECLWTAPEILRSCTETGSQLADVYSFGIILHEIATRELPFSNELHTMTIEEVLSLLKLTDTEAFRPDMLGDDSLAEFRTLIESCWSENPSLRPGSYDITEILGDQAVLFGASVDIFDNLLRRMEKYSNHLENLVYEKTTELEEATKKTDALLYEMLPRVVADKLCQGGQVIPEHFECVTIYFTDICGFTPISARSTPYEIINLLNDLYTCFDDTIGGFDVFKVETIGDAYMVVSGLPVRNRNMHTSEIARMALALQKATGNFRIRHLPGENLLLRAGIHSGPVVAGVVGLKMPRYCLFGDTVNTAALMESHGEERKIHMSGIAAGLLIKFRVFDIEERGQVTIKGKGPMKTFWLIGEREKSQSITDIQVDTRSISSETRSLSSDTRSISSDKR